MNKPTDHFDEHEWRLQERALREERLHAPHPDDPAVAGYRRVVRALREPVPGALPADFPSSVAAQAGLRRNRASGMEPWLLRLLVAVFVASALYVVANDGGAWLQAGLSLMPGAGTASLRHWGIALGACLSANWALGQWRDRAGQMPA